MYASRTSSWWASSEERVHYSGFATGPVVIATINFQLDFDELFSLMTLEGGPGPFVITDVSPGTYILAAFMDINGDGLPALSEPMGAYLFPRFL